MQGQERVGSVFDGRYRLDKLIGRGATADVYAAHDLKTQQAVAVKVITLAVENTHEAQQRFVRESQVQAMIRHKNVVALYASGITRSGLPYLVLELLRGKSLRTVIKSQGAVPPARAASYMWQSLQGLAAVHDQFVLHRDLKPANIMLEPSPGPVERVALIDFGFAALEGAPALTQTGSVVGSLTYIAPERLRGDGVDQRSDLYSLGVVMFELLMGAPPFAAGNDFDLIDLHRSEPPPPVTHDGHISPLNEIVQRALAKQPHQRYRSASEMAEAIEAVARTLPSDAPASAEAR